MGLVTKTFLFFGFVASGWCQETESTETVERGSKPFVLYWNAPSFQCRSHKIYFTGLAEKYGFVQNLNDDFRGNEIAILYDPGAFPAILTANNGEKTMYRNGGVPQEGSLMLHLKEYENSVNELIPDESFNGTAIIDFESWRPIFRQNFGTLTPYKDLSIRIEKQKYPFWSKNSIEKEATRRFEQEGRKYVEETLKLSKKLRPNANWGYYAYPYCFNMSPNNMETRCSSVVQKENDRIDWMFKISDILYPSLYMPEERLNTKQKVQMITGRIKETKRILKTLNKSAKIQPYFWYKYQDSDNFLTKEDLTSSLMALKSLGVDGIILWGASADFNSRARCQSVYDYINDILGPTLFNI